MDYININNILNREDEANKMKEILKDFKSTYQRKSGQRWYSHKVL